jgi:hypothetical protein
MANAERGVWSNTKDRVLWVAEKSTYVTVPLAVLAIASGGIAPVVGAMAIALDLGGAMVARRLRRKKNV